MIITDVPYPETQAGWGAIKALLEPAAKRGEVPVLEPHELVWVVIDEGQLLGAATTRVTPGWAEVVLVGGTDHQRWIGELDDLLGRWARDEGKNRLRAYGRKGWARVLKDWTVLGEEQGVTGYERVL